MPGANKEFAANQYIYPGKAYEGMEYFIDLDYAATNCTFLNQEFGLDFSALPSLYCPSNFTYITPVSRDLDFIFQKLWSLYDSLSQSTLQQMKVYSLSLFDTLLRPEQVTPAVSHTFYTKYQVQLAKSRTDFDFRSDSPPLCS